MYCVFQVFKAAQPALLYLVPFTLLPLFAMAYLKVNLNLHLLIFYSLKSNEYFHTG